jgi:hypothetical protein
MSLTIRTTTLPEADAKGSTEYTLTAVEPAGAFEVVVVGGGTGGAVAAIVAAQEGLRTAVTEAQSFLGGIGTGGGIHSYYFGLTAGLQSDIDARTAAWSTRVGSRATGFHPEAKKLALQELADEAGVTCLFRCHFAGVVMDGDAVRGVAFENDHGLVWLEAKVVLDCTGDGDVAAAAGAPILFGREGDASPQPYSLAPGHVDKNVVTFRNFDAGYCDPTNALDNTRATILGRSHVARERYDELTRMIYISPILGVRESRFIDAEYVVTLKDQQDNRRFPDAVMRVAANYDNHSFDYENESEAARLWLAGYSGWRTNMYHDVPYRALVPQHVENLLVACRALGVTHDAHQLFRMERAMQTLGEVAAVAARVAVRLSDDLPQDVTVRTVNVRQVQRRLAERGVVDADVLDERYATQGPLHGPEEAIRNGSVGDLLARFGTAHESEAMVELVQRGPALHAELVQALGSDTDDQRLMAAVALALQDKHDGVPVLRATVQARRADAAFRNQNMPRWLAAFYLLDHLGLRATGSIDLALAMLAEPAPNATTVVVAIRALGRHATADEAREAIVAAVANHDIETKQPMFSVEAMIAARESRSEGAPSYVFDDDRRFEVELAAAEALGTFGMDQQAARLAQPYLTDDRALVRSYARRVLENLPTARG